MESTGYRRRRSGIADARRAKLAGAREGIGSYLKSLRILWQVTSAPVRHFCIVDKRPVS
jgi:hypothetical protein